MRARRPDFDFSNSPVHWAPNPEFAQFLNSASVPFPFLERFLNRVMAKAAASLDSDDPKSRKLKEDIRTFIRQEANHYSLHERFNALLQQAGYDIAPIEDYIRSEYDRLWETKSFAFCLAYCEGFETLGPPFAHVILDQMDHLFEGADPEVVSLWKWHLMEEFEHRTVCYDAFHAIHGGYFLRVYGLIYQLRHLGGMVGRVRKLLLDQDRAHMTAEERAASDARIKAFTKSLRGNALRMLKALSPWYSPHGYAEPKAFRRFMADLEPRLR